MINYNKIILAKPVLSSFFIFPLFSHTHTHALYISLSPPPIYLLSSLTSIIKTCLAVLFIVLNCPTLSILCHHLVPFTFAFVTSTHCFNYSLLHILQMSLTLLQLSLLLSHNFGAGRAYLHTPASLRFFTETVVELSTILSYQW